jgi:hypothetical protein
MNTRLWVTAVLASLPLTAVAGWSIGWAATPSGHPYDWTVATLAATAAGTISLAVVTGLLAVMTAREVRLTSAIESERHRPVLVEITGQRSVGFQSPDPGSPSPGTLSIALRNVGLGPALNLRVRATISGAAPGGATVEGVATGSAEAIAVETAGDPPVLIRVPISVTLPSEGYTVSQYEELAQAFAITLTCIDRTQTEIPDALVQTS